jgi:hypothetical protein
MSFDNSMLKGNGDSPGHSQLIIYEEKLKELPQIQPNS